MMRGSNGPLYAGAVVVVLIFATLAWLVGVSPRLDRVAEANDARVAAEDRNFTLNLALEQRKADEKKIPEYQEQIYEIRGDLPPVQGIDDWRRDVDDIFKEYGLVVQSDVVGDAVPIPPTVKLTSITNQVGIRSPVDDLEFSGLVGTTYELEYSGDPLAALGVIDELQYGDHRFFLISGLLFSAADEDGDDPAVTLRPGDVVVTLVGMLFTLDYGNEDIQLPPPETVLECIPPDSLPEVLREQDPDEEPVIDPDTGEVVEPEFDITDGSFSVDGTQYSYVVEGKNFVITTEDGTEVPACVVDEKPEDFNPFVPLN